MIRFENGVDAVKGSIKEGYSIKIIEVNGCTVRWAAIDSKDVVGAAWLNRGQPIDEAMESIKEMVRMIIDDKSIVENPIDDTIGIDSELIETDKDEYLEASLMETPIKNKKTSVYKLTGEEQRQSMETKYGKHIYQYTLSENGKILTVTIACCDCGRFRTIKVQDLFQVKRCESCKKSLKKGKSNE